MAAARRRVLVWDPQADWLQFGYARADTLPALATLLRSSSRDAARVSFKGRAQEAELFSRFCELAFAWGRIKPALVIVEELAWVTSPAKAPAGWHELVTGGLKYGVDICSITQRPAESDKTALSQATVVQCFMMERPRDRRYMEAELGLDAGALDGLEPLHYVARDRRKRETRRGVITF